MGTSIALPLIDALVDRFATALPTTLVLDGYGNTDDPGNYLMIGVEDPDSDRATSAEGRQSWAGLGAKARDEEGTVVCVVLAWNGDPNGLRAARASAKAITDAVEADLRSGPNLGGVVPGLMWTGYGTRTQITQLQGADGTGVICIFDVAYRARI